MATAYMMTELSPVKGSHLRPRLDPQALWLKAVVSDLEVRILIPAASHLAMETAPLRVEIHGLVTPAEPHRLQKTEIQS